MKKTLFLLLMVQAIVFAQNPTKLEKVRITNNITSTTAAKVNVQEANGEVNTIAKADLIDVLNFASAVNLPTTGVAGKIYVTNDDNKIYRWNGTIYQPLSGAASTVNTAFTQKTFAAAMSVAHDAANPNFFVNITGNFSLSITGTQNGDSGIVNLVFGYVEGGGPAPIVVQTATLLANFNKEITSISEVIQVYFIHDSQGLKWYRDEVGSSVASDLQSVLNAGTYAETDSGNNYVDILGGTNNKYIDFSLSNGVFGVGQRSTSVNLDREGYFSANVFDNEVSSINMRLGLIELRRQAAETGKSTRVGLLRPTVDAQINFPAQTVAGNYVVKTRPLNSYTVATLPAAVLNDEATVTDATADAVLTGGGTLTIPVWYNGTAWTKLGGGSGGSINTSNLAVQDGTTLYHTVKRFAPTDTVSSSGTTVTSVDTRFNSSMVGAKLTINGESRLITAFTSNTTVTVASAYSTNYSGVLAANWGVYNVAVFVDGTGGIQIYGSTSALILNANANANTVLNSITGNGNVYVLDQNGLKLTSTGTLSNSSTSSTNNTADIGLRRNAAGVYEVYNGVTATGLDANRRDLLVRNLISKSNFYASDAAADADTALPSGAFYKITGSRGVNQKP